VGSLQDLQRRGDGVKDSLLHGALEDGGEDLLVNMLHDGQGITGVFGRDGQVENTDAPGAAVLLQIVEF